MHDGRGIVPEPHPFHSGSDHSLNVRGSISIYCSYLFSHHDDYMSMSMVLFLSGRIWNLVASSMMKSGWMCDG